MPTVEELGQRLKQKYPGSYDDMSDGELGRRLKQKYPGAYDDFTETSAQAAVPLATQGAPTPLQALKGVFTGEQRLTGEAPPLAPATQATEQAVQAGPGGVRGLAGRMTLPVATGFLAGPLAGATRMSLPAAEVVTNVVGEAAQQVKEGDFSATGLGVAAGTPLAIRGASNLAGRVLRGSRAARIAKQEEVQAMRNKLTRDHEQAMNAYRAQVARFDESMQEVRAENLTLQGDYTAAKQVQNRLRKAMQDRQRALVRAAAKEAERNVERITTYIDNVPAPTEDEVRALYASVGQFDLRFPANRIRDAQKALAGHEALLADFPALRSGTSTSLAQTGKEPAETYSLQELQAVRSRLGQRVASLKRDTSPTAREELAATTKLLAAVDETLDSAPLVAPGGDIAVKTLRTANQAYKKLRTVEDLGSLAGDYTRTLSDGRVVFNAAGMSDALRKNPVLRQRLESLGLYDEVQDTLSGLAKRTQKPPPLTLPRAPMQPGTDILGRGRMQLPEGPVAPPAPDLPRLPYDENLTRPDGGEILLQGGQAGAVATMLGADPGLSAGLGLLTSTVSRLLMSRPGQRYLLSVWEGSGGALGDGTLSLLNAGARAIETGALDLAQEEAGGPTR
jgi:hypothetical protein